MGTWRHRGTAARHRRARESAIATFTDGQLCAICTHPMNYGDRLELDHADDGTYRGLAHASPCRTCGRKCNPSAGGVKAALEAGKRLRTRPCVICGKQFTASRGTTGSQAATCGARDCLNELRRRRRAGEPDGEPPQPAGRVW